MSAGSRHPVWMSAPGPLVIAHRGGTEEAPEHTQAAYEHARDAGAEALELDVHATADRRLVVIHDPTLDRTTAGSGDVAQMTLDEINAATGSPRVPTLDEVLSGFALPLIIDVKRTEPEVEPYERELVELLRAHGRTGDVIVGSFHAAALARVRHHEPEVPTSLPPEEAYSLWASAHGGEPWEPPDGRTAAQVPMRWQGITVVDDAFVAQAHRHGLLVHVWTVNDPDDVVALTGMGVDGIITDRPAAMRALVDDLSAGAEAAGR